MLQLLKYAQYTFLSVVPRCLVWGVKSDNASRKRDSSGVEGEKTFFYKCCIMASRQVRLTWTSKWVVSEGAVLQVRGDLRASGSGMSQSRWEFCLCRVREWYCPLIALITPWRRVLLEKLTVPQLVEKLPAYYGTRMFISAFTKAWHLSLFWVRVVQPTYFPSRWSKVYFNIPICALVF